MFRQYPLLHDIAAILQLFQVIQNITEIFHNNKLFGSKIKNCFNMHKMIYLCIKRRAHMRTTLDLPEDLLNDAMKTTHIQTKTKVIITALEELIRKAKISQLKHYKGKVDIDIDIDTLRDRQCQ
jgi:Arc/MetJ family transcription regulator